MLAGSALTSWWTLIMFSYHQCRFAYVALGKFPGADDHTRGCLDSGLRNWDVWNSVIVQIIHLHIAMLSLSHIVFVFSMCHVLITLSLSWFCWRLLISATAQTNCWSWISPASSFPDDTFWYQIQMHSRFSFSNSGFKTRYCHMLAFPFLLPYPVWFRKWENKKVEDRWKRISNHWHP